jgi:hypothetical protein
MLYNYAYAHTLNGGKYIKDKLNKLKEMDTYELLYIMVEEQKKADLTPTQNNIRTSYISRIINKIPKED